MDRCHSSNCTVGGAIFAVIYISCSLPGGLGETIDIAVANGKFDLGATNFDLKDATMWTVIIAACFTHLTTYGRTKVWCSAISLPLR